MGQRVNVQETAPIFSNVRPIKRFDDHEPDKPSWIIRATNWIGLTMTKTENPRGWSFNPATVTLALVIIGMVAAGAYYMGQRDSEANNLLKRIDAAEKKAEAADTKATYAVSGADERSGHKPGSNTNGGK